MTGYPKKSWKKRRKKHMNSILQKKDGTCYLCRMLHGDTRGHLYLEEHHIFGGSRRDLSEANGLKAWLCVEHHRTGAEAVHRNEKVNRALQAVAQAEYEKTHTREQWMKLMGKNYRENE